MRNLCEHMYVAEVVLDFLFCLASWLGWKIRMRNLCEHMDVAKVVSDLLFFGQLTGLKNKNAEPLWTHVRREGRFRFLIFWPADWAEK